jgi:hypothetical protein
MPVGDHLPHLGQREAAGDQQLGELLAIRFFSETGCVQVRNGWATPRARMWSRSSSPSPSRLAPRQFVP